MAKTKASTPTPKLQDFDSHNARLTLLDPVLFNEIPGAWMDIAGVFSQEFEDAKLAVMLKAKAAGFNADASEEERMRVENVRMREATGHLIVGWNEEFFGQYSKDAAVELMTHPKRVWIYLQVEDFLKRQENFFKA
jgi:hypothetical protein